MHIITKTEPPPTTYRVEGRNTRNQDELGRRWSPVTMKREFGRFAQRLSLFNAFLTTVGALEELGSDWEFRVVVNDPPPGKEIYLQFELKLLKEAAGQLHEDLLRLPSSRGSGGVL
jgi:hypothetical protein